jgi:Cellulose biosynthesis GIL
MAKLGVAGLPQAVETLAEGGVYGIASDQPSVRIPLIARSVVATVANGQRVVVFSSVENAAYFKRARLTGCDLAMLARLGQLHFVRQRQEAEAAGPSLKRMLAELRYFKLPERSLLLIDLADELLQCLDLIQLSEALAMLNAWAESGKHSVLLVFSLSGLGPKAFANLKTASETLAGFAVTRSAEDETVLGVRHWFGLKGPASRGSFALTVSEDGLVLANASSVGLLSVDQGSEAYLVTRRAFEDFGVQASQWTVVDSALDALEVLRQSLAGTVVLHFDSHGEMRELAQSVAAIRALGRPQIRIVIRECNARLRTAQMVALFRLGVSVIVPQSLSGTAGRLMAESLAGSLVTRNFETDVKKALAQARVDFRPGPLGAEEFKGAIELLLNAASEMDLPCTLVVLNPQTALASNAALSSIKRALRDAVFAESDDGIWVFLFGCAPESAQTVMTRLLGARFENLLIGWRRLSGAREILPMLSLYASAHTEESGTRSEI